MLEKIETDLAAAGPAQARRLRRRAELIRDLLAPTPLPVPMKRRQGEPVPRLSPILCNNL
jgi:hypothetical protein